MAAAATAFALHGVDVVHRNGHLALEGLTLAVRHGERVALVGPSGAGKTTLLRLLGLSLAPADGRFEMFGSDPWRARAGELRRLRSRIGHLHQNPPIPPRQRVVHAVLAGRLGQWPWWRSLASLLMPVDCQGAAAELARLDMAGRLFERCDRLSGGQLQRVALARVLYQRPQLLLADEPVAAMDPALAELTVRLLNAEASRRGVTLVASMHAVELALRHFERVIGVRGGRLLFDLPADRVAPGRLDALYESDPVGASTRPAQARQPSPTLQPCAVVSCR